MLRGNWWEIFNEPELNALEDQLNINNQNIKIYFENFMAARALIAEARSQYWPTITASPVVEPLADLRQSARTRRPPTPGNTQRSGRCRSTSPGRPICGARFATRCARRNTPPRSAPPIWKLEKLTEQASLAEYYLRDSRPGHAAADPRPDRRGRPEGAGCRAGRVRRRRRRLYLGGRGADHAAVRAVAADQRGPAARAVRARHRHADGQGGHGLLDPGASR